MKWTEKGKICTQCGILKTREEYYKSIIKNDKIFKR